VKDEEFFSKAELKNLGWTDGSIKKFLESPDRLKPNPVYRSRAPMQLFHKERVFGVMDSLEWMEWFEKSKSKRAKQSATQRENNSKKREKLVSDALAELQFTPPEVGSKKHLYKKAIHHWHKGKIQYLKERDDLDFPDKPNVEDVDKPTLRRWCKNMLRHKYSTYEQAICHLGGEMGGGEAYLAVRREVDIRIDEWMAAL